MVKFLHTADCHLGIKYAQLGDKGDHAREMRIKTFEKVINLGEERKVDFILIAGDLFDSNDLDRRIVNVVCEILTEIAPIPIYIIPGNHDPLRRDSLYLEDAWKAADNVTLLTKEIPFNVPYTNATIYPCPVNVKDSEDDPTEWIDAENDEISIGLAHGNLQFENYDTKFPINPHRAEIANLDYLALGEWHSFGKYFNDGVYRTVYPGTPEVTTFKENNVGQIVMVNIEEPGSVPSIKTYDVGRFKWQKMESTINDLNDIKNLERDLFQIRYPEKLLLNLSIKGVVDENSFEYLEKFQQKISEHFMFLKLQYDDLHLKPDLIQFKSALPNGILLYNTFSALMALMKLNNETREYSEISSEEN